MGFREEEELEYLKDKLTARIVELEEEVKRLSNPVRSAFWGTDIEKMLSDHAHEIMASGHVNRFAERIGKEIATYVHDTELHIVRMEKSHAVLEGLLHDKARQLIDALDKISELEENEFWQPLSWDNLPKAGPPILFVARGTAISGYYNSADVEEKFDGYFTSIEEMRFYLIDEVTHWAYIPDVAYG